VLVPFHRHLGKYVELSRPSWRLRQRRSWSNPGSATVLRQGTKYRYNVILVSQKTETCVYRWLRAHAMLDVTVFPHLPEHRMLFQAFCGFNNWCLSFV